ncbi:MAG: VWA domain-containing protein, partial [Planctomycetota bacterium]
RLWILVIDCSYSMDYQSGGQSRLDEAKMLAIETVDQAAENDAFALIGLSDPSRAVIRQPTFNRNRVRTAIESLKTNDLGADLESTFGQIEGILDQASQLTEIPKQTSAVIYSDMGNDTWSGQLEWDALVETLPDAVAVEVASVAAETPWNTFVTGLQATPTARIPGLTFRVDADIRQVNAVKNSDLEVMLLVDGIRKDTQPITLPAEGSLRVTFDVEFATAGLHSLTVQLPEDRLANDNRRHLVITTRSTTRVLVMEDSAGDSRTLQLASGLSPDPQVFESPESLSAESLSPLQIVGRNLNRFDMIVCFDLSYVSESVLEKLQGYVSQGGSLLVCLGENTRAAQWNVKPDLLGFSLTQPSEFGDWRIDPLEYESSIARPFQGFPESGLLTTPIFRFWNIAQTNPLLESELGIRNEGPLITTVSVDRGTVACLLSAPTSNATTRPAASGSAPSSTPTPEGWNALPTWPSFVPLVRELFQALLDSKQESYNLECGQFLSGISNKLSPLEVQVTDPKNNVTSVRSEQTNSGIQQWFFSRTQDHGLYQVSTARDESENAVASSSGLFALNLDPRQSDLTAAPVPKLRRSSAEIESGSEFVTDPQVGQLSVLSRYSLIVLILLLCSESLLAWQFGRRLQ